ncbi:MAG TPA: SOS response-associated peptidase [Kofleriaceae bacterium]|nr:SOS response-associated peptidase [Kofleriaceae bacterium]
MCGRYTLTRPEEVPDLLAPVLDEAALPEELAPRYNVAPTQTMPIVANRDQRVVELARWGLIPSWVDDPSIGSRLINARGESLGQKPAFRDAFARRRCLVPADGFFEWQKAGKRKQPYFIHIQPRRAFAFAGLWDRWRDTDQTWVISFTIVTCAANPLLSRLHDRMPVVVGPDDYERWLTREPLEPDALQDIIAPADPAGWTTEAVGEWVNRADHEGPECIESRPVQGILL